MLNPFVGQIATFGFTFAPVGWALCNGQLLPISQNTALFSILGTTYGGDGKTTFALPNLQGSAALHSGNSAGPGLSPRQLGEMGGETDVTLIQSEMPAHTHPLNCNSAAGTNNSPTNGVWAEGHVAKQTKKLYAPTTDGTLMNPQALDPAGGNGSHNNMPPYLVLNFCIALQGIFPPRS